MSEADESLILEINKGQKSDFFPKLAVFGYIRVAIFFLNPPPLTEVSAKKRQGQNSLTNGSKTRDISGGF
jgi:hypothetical protein